MTITNQIHKRMDELEKEFQETKQSIQEHQKAIDTKTASLLKLQGEYEGLNRLTDLPNDQQLKAKKK